MKMLTENLVISKISYLREYKFGKTSGKTSKGKIMLIWKITSQIVIKVRTFAATLFFIIFVRRLISGEF